MEKKYTVKINNKNKIEQLLQETYDLACQQYKQLQNEINKIANTTNLKDLDIEGKEKYGKIMSNYISLQHKSTQQKFDIAKLMSDIMKYNGDIENALNDSAKAGTTLDISALRKIAKEANSVEGQEQIYQIKS